MTTTATEEQEILVRGSAAYKDYMRHRAGWLKALVNGLEDYLAISGRSLLLIFLIYTTVKAGIALMHVNAPIWLEVLMLSLQVAGVEGAVPGLARHKEVLTSQGREKDGRTIGRAINSTRTLAVLTGLEIVLSLTPTLDGFDMAPINDAYSKILLIARLVVISNFLIAMARMEKQGPKIISQAEHDKQQNALEQEQIRMDNAAIQEAITQALPHWTQQQEQRLDALATHLEAAVRQHLATSEAKHEAVRQRLEAQYEANMRQQTTKSEASKHEAKSSASRDKDEAGAKILPLRQASVTVSEVKAEVYRLADTGLSSYQIAPLVSKSPATIQRWLKDRPEQQTTASEANKPHEAKSEATREATEPAM